MGVEVGKEGFVTVQATDAAGDVTGSATDALEITGFTISEETGVAEGKTMGNGYAHQKGTFKKWGGTVNFLLDPSDAGQLLLVNGAYIEFVGFPHGRGLGKPKRTGKATVVSVEEGVEVESYVSLAVSIAGDGALVRGTDTA